MTGTVIKILSEFCYVRPENETELIPCKSKGIFRHEKIKVITGDVVDFEKPVGQDLHGIVTKIHERRSELYRPQIANIDQVVIISSVKDPNFDSYILSKYLTFVSFLNIRSVVTFTKIDLIPTDSEIFNFINDYKNTGLIVFKVNNKQPDSEEWEPFNQELHDKVSVFTGQTGAGKSTTLNNLLPDVFQKTQEISKALGRGKHTTTSNELFSFGTGFIADTPGFSSFELKNIKPEDVAQHFLNFGTYNCKFNDCLHNSSNEKICGVYDAFKKKKIPEFMFNDYLKLSQEIAGMKGKW
jgi:ribosome biogenesis GTPase